MQERREKEMQEAAQRNEELQRRQRELENVRQQSRAVDAAQTNSTVSARRSHVRVSQPEQGSKSRIQNKTGEKELKLALDANGNTKLVL